MFGDGIEELLYQARILLPKTCHLSIDKLKNRQNNLPIEEEKYLANFSPKRQEEFVGGRNIARLAVETLTSGNIPTIILRDDYGCPLWPQGIVGSISHKLSLVGALVGYKNLYKGIGFDIEKIEPLEPRSWKYFSTIEEINTARTLALDDSIYANMLFSIKESIFKCIYPLYNQKTPKLSFLKPEVISDEHGYTASFRYLSTVCTVKVLINNDVIISLCIAD